jgi:hypothetical protein
MRTPALVFSLLLTMVGAAVAQTTVLVPGQQVRLWEQGRTAVHHVARLTPDSLFLHAAPAVPHGIALADIQRMDVRVRRTRVQQAANDMVVGSLVGAVAGAVFGFAKGGFSLPEAEIVVQSKTETAVIFGILGLGGGFAMGGLAAMILEPRFTWRSAEFPLAPPPYPGS